MRQDRGGVIVEFMISLPLLLILFFGLANIGKFLSIAPGIGNAAYNVALVGTETSPGTVNGAMAYRRDTLFHNMKEKKDIEILTSTNAVYPPQNPGTVQITMSGTLKNPQNSPFFSLSKTSQGLTVTAPILGLIRAVTDGTPQNNGAGTYYGCNQQVLAGTDPNTAFCTNFIPGYSVPPAGSGGSGGYYGGGYSSGNSNPCPAVGAATAGGSGEPVMGKATYSNDMHASTINSSYDSPCSGGNTIQ